MKPKSLLRDPVIIDLMRACKTCGGPYRACDCMPSPLVVTRNGVPCPDQKAALEEFKNACRRMSAQTAEGDNK